MSARRLIAPQEVEVGMHITTPGFMDIFLVVDVERLTPFAVLQVADATTPSSMVRRLALRKGTPVTLLGVES